MKKFLMFFAILLSITTSCTSHNKQTTMQQSTTNEKKVLVAYFSATRTTEAVAKTIANETGAQLYAITPKQLYTAADLDWHNQHSRSSVEMSDSTSRPELADASAQVNDYDIILVGFPIWWYTCPTIINTFFETYDFRGKKVALFCTSGGSTISKAQEQLRAQYKGIEWLPAATLNGGKQDVKRWIGKLGI